MVAVADLTVGQGVAAALPNFTSEHSSLELRRSWQPCWRRVKEEDFFFEKSQGEDRRRQPSNEEVWTIRPSCILGQSADGEDRRRQPSKEEVRAIGPSCALGQPADGPGRRLPKAERGVAGKWVTARTPARRERWRATRFRVSGGFKETVCGGAAARVMT
jgi:hypothetical protein